MVNMENNLKNAIMFINFNTWMCLNF
jgi:hypothetical protein